MTNRDRKSKPASDKPRKERSVRRPSASSPATGPDVPEAPQPAPPTATLLDDPGAAAHARAAKATKTKARRGAAGPRRPNTDKTEKAAAPLAAPTVGNISASAAPRPPRARKADKPQTGTEQPARSPRSKAGSRAPRAAEPGDAAQASKATKARAPRATRGTKPGPASPSPAADAIAPPPIDTTTAPAAQSGVQDQTTAPQPDAAATTGRRSVTAKAVSAAAKAVSAVVKAVSSVKGKVTRSPQRQEAVQAASLAATPPPPAAGPVAPPPASPAPSAPPRSAPTSRAANDIDPRTAGAVLWVASEAVPLASTGGLGDVVGALPGVLRTLGWDARVCLPYYRQQIKQAVSPPLYSFDLDLAEPLRVLIRELVDPPGGVPTYLIDCPPLFDRGGLYVDAAGAFVDNPYRFGAFQLAVLELAAQLEPRPCIIHSHDWHASLLPALVRLPGRAASKLHDIRTIFTIHNLQYQGDTERGIIDVLDLPAESWSPDWAEHYGRFIPMKAAIVTSDRVTTVSPTYAEELRGPIRGQGLDGFIRSRGSDMRGLINGIDDVSWNPATDKALKVNFSAAEPQGREACKKALRAEVDLPDRPDRPLIGFIGRLVTDKGVDLIMDALPEILAMDAQVVILGSGERDLEARLRALQAEFADKPFRALIKFDLALSRRLYGAFDMLLVPSRLEPCGLVQLYALRYGAVPIAHAVGGLRDTVKEGENGFVFSEPTARALTDAVSRAVALWSDQHAWKALQRRGMQQDFSWRNAALPYDALYREVLTTPIRRAALPPPPPKPTPPPPPPLPKVETASFRLMVQGPRALYAYWEFPAGEPLELVVEERPSGVIFTAAAELPPTGERWMGALPDQAYRAILRGRGGRVVALSNAVVTPLEAPPPPEAPQPAWLESAVELGVFEQDNEGRKWASVFPEAASFTATPTGDLQPEWHTQQEVAQQHAQATDVEDARETPPAHEPHVPTPPVPASSQQPEDEPRTFSAVLARWMNPAARTLEPSAVAYVPSQAHSATWTRPFEPPPPGRRALDMRDVMWNPAGARTSAASSDGLALPTSADLVTRGRSST